MYDFSADEIFEMARQLEINGAKFYRDAAAGAEDEEVKKMLETLAAMEDQHEKSFAAMKADLTEGERKSVVFDPENEAGAYLKALADTRVFFEKEIDITSLKEVLKSAIVAEKDSIVFYLGMQQAVSDAGGKEKIDRIIKEEMDHIRLLSGYLARVSHK